MDCSVYNFMYAPKWLLRPELCHLFVCLAAGTVLLLRVQLGYVSVFFFFFSFFHVLVWTDVNVKHSEHGGKSQKKNAHNGEMRETTWEDARYACHYQKADREIVCACPLSLVQSPSALASCKVSLAGIKKKKNQAWQREQVRRRKKKKCTRER